MEFLTVRFWQQLLEVCYLWIKLLVIGPRQSFLKAFWVKHPGHVWLEGGGLRPPWAGGRAAFLGGGQVPGKRGERQGAEARRTRTPHRSMPVWGGHLYSNTVQASSLANAVPVDSGFYIDKVDSLGRREGPGPVWL